MRFVTDLRGLTRPAVSLALRTELQLTGEARERGIGACGNGGAWAIVTGTPPMSLPPGRTRERRPTDADGGKSEAAAAAPGATPVTMQTAISFLEAEGIAYQQSRGLLLVEAIELERVAAEAATATRRQHVWKVLLLYSSIVASGLAATSIVPRLLHQPS